ncbi:MAG: MBL fold metallo-hydrolase [Cyanobacteriota bacterium]
MQPERPPLRLIPLGTDPHQQGCAYWLEMGSHSGEPYRLLLDCGLPGPVLLKVLPGIPDAVICSHAHFDHLQGLPTFHRRYPQVPLYATPVTAHLATGLWERGVWPGYDRELRFPPFRALPFGQAREILPHLMLTFFTAGHLPGAAATLLQNTQTTPAQTCVYSGDCSLASTRFAPGLDLTALRHWQPDLLLMEASLGATRHPARRHLENRLVERLLSALEAGQTVLFPLPVLGLGQELIFLLKAHHRFTQSLKDLKVWVAPGLAAGCDLYERLLPQMPEPVRNFATYQPLFWENRLQPHIQPLTEADPLPQGLLLCDADAGPESWDPIWSRLLAQPQRSCLLVLLPEVELATPFERWPTLLRARIQVESMAWHSHNDVGHLTQIIHTFRPQHLVLIHGSPKQAQDLADLPELCNRYHVHCPQPGRELEFPDGRLQTPTQGANLTHFKGSTAAERGFYADASGDSAVRYEGEVEEVWQDHTTPRSIAGVQVRLPAQITEDPRWLAWADTGLVEARWQGSELVLRGLSPRELIRPAEAASSTRGISVPHPKHSPGLANRGMKCQSCRFARQILTSQTQAFRCDQERSPLYRLRVDPQGTCPYYQPEEICSSS